VLSPIQLNQEAMDGVGALLNHPRVGIRKIKALLNPTLELKSADASAASVLFAFDRAGRHALPASSSSSQACARGAAAPAHERGEPPGAAVRIGRTAALNGMPIDRRGSASLDPPTRAKLSR
jgi:hypothetical protein